MLLQVANPKKTEHEFIRIQKCKVDKNGIPSIQKFKMMFESKACSSRTIAASAFKYYVEFREEVSVELREKPGVWYRLAPAQTQGNKHDPLLSVSMYSV